MRELLEVPKTWLILALLAGMVAIRCLGFDSWATASLASLMGYLLGVKLEQGRKDSGN